MKRALAALVCLQLVACASPTVTATPTIAPLPISLSPSPSITIACSTLDPPGPTPLPGGCPAEEAAVLAAVAPLGYAIGHVEIHPYRFLCGVPFWSVPDASTAPTCPVALDGPTAYVSFFGTDKVAALTFASNGDESLTATVVAFEVPPSGPAPA